MGNLILNSLEIRNFRGFQHLAIERLGRVNLIVGKNNIGKSSLLEALQLYARRGSPRLIKEMLEGRDEGSLSSPTTYTATMIENLLPGLKYFFYGRKLVQLLPITIGPVNSSEDTLSILVGGFVDLNTPEDIGPRFSIHLGTQQIVNVGSSAMFSGFLMVEPAESINHVFIPPNGLQGELIGRLWDGIALTNLETEVIDALRIAAPGIEGLSIIGDPGSVRGRIPIIKLTDIDEPIPMRSLGDGMQRILTIALALVNSKNGIVLIDEFENGIYYSAQPELWQFIFKLAHRLNVQVFATTHSWDCVEGFQKAAQENTEEEGMLVRLSLLGDDVIATLFDERRLGIATRQQIEVR